MRKARLIAVRTVGGRYTAERLSEVVRQFTGCDPAGAADAQRAQEGRASALYEYARAGIEVERDGSRDRDDSSWM
jgi:hypothetical protein